MKKKIYILHENKTWIEPLIKELKLLNTPFEEWDLSRGEVNLQEKAPEGIYYNRMSASSHTRGHHFAVELTEAVIAWLERDNRTLLNGRRAILLEVRKTEQYTELQRFNLKVPHTIACLGKDALVNAAKKFEGKPFLIKPNRGGKGLGIQLFENSTQFNEFIEQVSSDYVGGITLLQEYISPADQNITRLEFINGKFYYAVKVDASDGFELCPADGCQVQDAFCPVGPEKEKFEVLDNFYIPEIETLEALFKENDIRIGAVEFVEDKKGNRYFYDINTNTNYNDAAEEKKGNKKKGMRAIANLLKTKLDKMQA